MSVETGSEPTVAEEAVHSLEQQVEGNKAEEELIL